MVRTIKSVNRSNTTIFGGQILVKSSSDVLIPESKTYNKYILNQKVSSIVILQCIYFLNKR